jgi:hypothetical protein
MSFGDAVSLRRGFLSRRWRLNSADSTDPISPT